MDKGKLILQLWDKNKKKVTQEYELPGLYTEAEWEEILWEDGEIPKEHYPKHFDWNQTTWRKTNANWESSFRMVDKITT